MSHGGEHLTLKATSPVARRGSDSSTSDSSTSEETAVVVTNRNAEAAWTGSGGATSHHEQSVHSPRADSESAVQNVASAWMDPVHSVAPFRQETAADDAKSAYTQANGGRRRRRRRGGDGHDAARRGEAKVNDLDAASSSFSSDIATLSSSPVLRLGIADGVQDFLEEATLDDAIKPTRSRRPHVSTARRGRRRLIDDDDDGDDDAAGANIASAFDNIGPSSHFGGRDTVGWNGVGSVGPSLVIGSVGPSIRLGDPSLMRSPDHGTDSIARDQEVEEHLPTRQQHDDSRKPAPRRKRQSDNSRVLSGKI